jgi:hypothetical protein
MVAAPKFMDRLGACAADGSVNPSVVTATAPAASTARTNLPSGQADIALAVNLSCRFTWSSDHREVRTLCADHLERAFAGPPLCCWDWVVSLVLQAVVEALR